jgi:hypothetical protein
MPANLPPQFIELRQQLGRAKTPVEKIAILEEMLAVIPKHKGTDKLQGEIKSRLAKLRVSAQQRAKFSSRGDSFYVEKEGAGQIVLIGPPNSGKSTLLANLTKAKPLIADYPYTTRHLLPGMMKFENIQIQLVDLPALGEFYLEPGFFQVIRLADGICLVLDLADDPLDQFNKVKLKLHQHRIGLAGERKKNEEIRVVKKSLVVLNKIDLPGAKEIEEIFKSLFEENLEVLTISAREKTGLAELSRKIYQLLEVIRVYPKVPGKEPDFDEPVVLPKESCVFDFAQQIHKEMAEKLSFARLYYPHQEKVMRVSGDFPLGEGDIVELHLK